MNTKLTLRLDKDLIEEMKIYAMKNQTSLSKLTEAIYREILKGSPVIQKEHSSLANKYRGVIDLDNIAGNDEVTKTILEKHL